MNLDQITTKCWILALFERDDGERLLLGDGWFDFKDSLQHFQPNTFANDVIELQGSDGQMLAGQVRRGAPQSFDGYIGDPITNRQTIEQHRREFLMFFRKRHHYKVVYIFPDGTAIQRRQGYITDAPSVPEIRQRFPEYHVALNFEDVNYYEYAENAQGEEIFSNIRNINISTAATGGLVWDNLGAVSDQMGWKDIATATGQMLTITNPESIKAPIASFEMTGSTIQDGTPTPSAPVPVQTVTGRQGIKVVGKNLLQITSVTTTSNGVTLTVNPDGTISTSGTANALVTYNLAQGQSSFSLPVGAYTLSGSPTGGSDSKWRIDINNGADGNMRDYGNGGTFTVTTPLQVSNVRIRIASGTNVDGLTFKPMIKLGNSASSFEPYRAQEYEINLNGNAYDRSSAYMDGNDMKIPISITAGATYAFSAPTRWVGVYLYDSSDTLTRTIGHTASTRSGEFTANSGEVKAIFTFYAGSDATWSWSDIEFYNVAEKIELCKIGTYQDRIYKENGKWWLYKEIGKVVFNGSENWSLINSGASNFYYNLPVFVTPKDQDIMPVSNYFIGTPITNGNTSVGLWITSAGTIRARKETEQTLADYKTWLGTVLPSVYYVLATPTTTEITNEEVLEGLNSAAGLKLFPGQNNITDQTPNAQPTMTVQYYTALGPGGGLVWESGEAGGATIVEASGLDSAFPLWTVPGPSTNPTLTNITTGQSITWQGTVPAGQTLEIDMDKQTATLAGANVYAFVSGDWIRIDPGSNRMTYVGTGATQASTLSWNNIVG